MKRGETNRSAMVYKSSSPEEDGALTLESEERDMVIVNRITKTNGGCKSFMVEWTSQPEVQFYILYYDSNVRMRTITQQACVNLPWPAQSIHINVIDNENGELSLGSHELNWRGVDMETDPVLEEADA